MADKRLRDLDAVTTPVLTDVVAMDRAGLGEVEKATFTQLQTLLVDETKVLAVMAALSATLDLNAQTITNVGTVDGRDIATDGTKLDGIEALADVTDATNVATAGAPIISSGAGAPGTTPAAVGDVYVDTTGDNAYIAAGTASSADWKQATGAGGGDLLAANNLSDVANAATSLTNLGVTTAAQTVTDDATVAAMVDTLGGASSSGTGGLVRITSAALVTPDLGTPSAVVLTNATGTAASLTVGATTGVEAGADVTDATNVAAAGAVMDTLADAKGDIFGATAADTVARLAVGTNDQVLTADSAEATGLKWAAAGGGGTVPPTAASSSIREPASNEWIAPWRGVANDSTARSIDGTFRVNVVPFAVPWDVDVDVIQVEVTTAQASGLARVGLYNATASNVVSTLLQESANVDVSTTGVKTVSITSQALTAFTTYFLAYQVNDTGVAFRGWTPPLSVGSIYRSAHSASAPQSRWYFFGAQDRTPVAMGMPATFTEDAFLRSDNGFLHMIMQKV